jgi:hypothetical protein
MEEEEHSFMKYKNKLLEGQLWEIKENMTILNNFEDCLEALNFCTVQEIYIL